MKTPSDHQTRLEERLVARFEALHPKKEGHMFRFALRSIALVAVAAAGLGFASQTPADFPVELGKSIDVVFAEKGAPPVEPEDIVEKLRMAGEPKAADREVQVSARLQTTPAGAESLHLEIWGDTVPLMDIERTLRQSFPGLAKAAIAVAPLQGRVRTTLAGAIAHRLFTHATTPEQIEAARQELIAQIRASGEKGNIDVQVEGTGGDRRVEVRIQNKEIKGE
jgi:hypothetical protein